MADYVEVTDAEIDPESPVTTSLLSRLRDNAIAMITGSLGAPRVKPVILHIQYVVDSGTNGGAAAATTWNTRSLNTVVTNEITGASLASNKITLPAGTYDIDAMAFYRSTEMNQLAVYNETDAAFLFYGMNYYGQAAVSFSNVATIRRRFTLAATKEISIKHYTQGATDTSGLGLPVSIAGVSEIYVDVKITQVG